MDFYDVEEFEKLLGGAKRLGREYIAFILLGGEAGLRLGEILALEWGDIDFKNRVVTVSKSDWRGEITVPKGGKVCQLPMTTRLSDALQDVRHLHGTRVLFHENGDPMTFRGLQVWMKRIHAKAGLPGTGNVHRLRHTFCSRLAIKGASPKAVQELARHQSLTTTMRYMHLSPSARQQAIELLNTAPLEK
jgi:integrase